MVPKTVITDDDLRKLRGHRSPSFAKNDLVELASLPLRL
jgi:hypothetical protein